MRISILAPLLLAVAAPAQGSSCYYNHVPSPPVSGSAQSRLFSPGGFGAQGILLQFRIGRLQFQNLPQRVTSLSVLPGGNGVRTFRHLRVRMGYTTLNGLGPDLVANRCGPMTTVLAADNREWYNIRDQWNDIGLQQPFVYQPARGDLLVEIHVTEPGWQGEQPYADPNLFHSRVLGALASRPAFVSAPTGRT